MPFFTNKDHRIHYTETGSGPLLLLLTGNTASSVHLQGELEYFGQRFRAVALDFWGTGQSDRLAVWPVDWWRQAARDAAALVRHLGQERCLAMGLSGGAVVALWLAIDHPDLTRAVVADSEYEKFAPGEFEAILALRNLADPGAAEWWQAGHGDDWQAVVQADSDMIRRFAAAGGDFYEGRLAQVRCPVLFTGSLSDPFLPQLGEQILAQMRQIPGSQAFVCQAGSHPLMWSRPAEFRQAADAFLDSV